MSSYNYLKKITRKLQDIPVDIEETGDQSDYFEIYGLEPIYGMGIHTLLIRGSRLLKRGTFIYVSVQDETGFDMLLNLPSSSESYEDNFIPFRRFTINIDEGFPNVFGQTIQGVSDGVATMWVVGTTLDGKTVRWHRKFAISKSIQNQPLIDRGEWVLGEFYNIGDVVFYQNGFYKTILSHISSNTINPLNLTYWRRLGADSGLNTALLVLSNDSHTVHYSYDLTPNYTGAFTSASVFRGELGESSEWIIEVESISGNISGTLLPNTPTGTKVFTVTNIPPTEVGTVNFRAYKEDWTDWQPNTIYQDTNLVQFIDTTVVSYVSPSSNLIEVGETEISLTGSFYEYKLLSSSGVNYSWLKNGVDQGNYTSNIIVDTTDVPLSASYTFSCSFNGRNYSSVQNVINLNANGTHSVIRTTDGRNQFVIGDTSDITLEAELWINAVEETIIDGYQWYQDGVSILNATNSSYLVTTESIVNFSSSYSVDIYTNGGLETHSSHLFYIYDVEQDPNPNVILGTIYEATSAHTSNDTNRPPNSSFWQLKSNIGILRKSFSVNTTTDGVDNPALIINSAQGDTFKNLQPSAITLTASIIAGGTEQDVSLNTFTWKNGNEDVIGNATRYLPITLADLSGSEVSTFTAQTTFNGNPFTGSFTVKYLNDGVSFYIDSDNGYTIRNDSSSVNLQIKFNVGGRNRRNDLTNIQWYKDSVLLASTSLSLEVQASDVEEKSTFLASASFNGENYEATRDVVDISDVVSARILSNNEGFIFRNAYSSNKLLTASLIKGGEEVDPSNISYQWYLNGTPVGTDQETYEISADDILTSGTIRVEQTYISKTYNTEELIENNTRFGTQLFIESHNGYTIKNGSGSLALTASLKMFGEAVNEVDISDYEWYKNGVLQTGSKYYFLTSNDIDNVDAVYVKATFKSFEYTSQEINVVDVLDGVNFYISSNDGYSFKNSDGELHLTASLYWGNREYDAESYLWEIRNDNDVSFSTFATTKAIVVTNNDVTNKAVFRVTAQFEGEEFVASELITDITDGLVLSLTNEQCVINFNNAGIGNYDNAFATASVLLGGENVTSQWTLSTGSKVTSVGSIGAVFNPTNGVLQITSVANPTDGYIPIVATKGSVSVTRNFHVVSTQDGFTAYSVDLVSPTLNIKYDVSNNLVSPTSNFNLTAIPTNIPTPYYKFYRSYDNGSETNVQSGASNSFTVNTSTFGDFTANANFRVEVKDVDDTGAVLAQDVLTIYKTFDGQDGETGYTVDISNENHTVYCDQSGNPIGGELGTGGSAVTFITAFKGGTGLEIENLGSTGVATSGKYRLSASVSSGVTIGSESVDSYTARYWVNSFSNNSGVVTFYVNTEASGVFFTKSWTLTKQIPGQDGNPGTDGDDGKNGGGVVFRGEWDNSTTYYYTEGVRVDVVYYTPTTTYYAAKTNNVNKQPNTNPTDWAGFGADFTSIATGLLLAQDAIITKTLVMGTNDGINTGAGIIRSVNATSVTNGQGFYLSASGDMRFGTDVTGSNFIRFTKDTNSIQIKSDNFVLSGSTTLRIDTNKVALGANAGTITVNNTDVGTILSSSGHFKTYINSTNYLRINSTGIDVKASDFTLIGGSGGNTVGIDGSGIVDSSKIVLWAGDSTPAFAPFRVTADGSLYASSATIAGTITANAVEIGTDDYWRSDLTFRLGGTDGITYSGTGNVKIGTGVDILGTITATEFSINGNNYWNASSGFRTGDDDSFLRYNAGVLTLSQSNIDMNSDNYWTKTGLFKVGNSTKNLIWDGTDLTITGKIYATDGAFTGSLSASAGIIGGWTIATNTLTATGGSNKIVLDGDSNSIQTTTMGDANGFTLSASGIYWGSSGGSNTYFEASTTKIELSKNPSLVSLNNGVTIQGGSGNNVSVNTSQNFLVDISGNIDFDAVGIFLDGTGNSRFTGTSGILISSSASTVELRADAASMGININGGYFAVNSTYFDVNGANGNLDISGTGTGTNWVATSDIKLKENILQLDRGLSDVLKLNPVSFNLISDEDKKKNIGFIAQEMEQVIPEVVGFTKNKEGDIIKNINYSVLVSVLAKAIQEQQVQIDDLKRKLDGST